MSLAPGARLGPYGIVAPIGEGGMGKVYRARDARLDRDVAVKMLPAGLLDADRLRRFELEARAAAALNHPNILAVYDVGVHEGRHTSCRSCSTGETLRERAAAAERLPVRQAIDYRGPDRARPRRRAREGHRPSRPQARERLLTDDGRVKILDFGLAKLAEARGREGHGPTRRRPTPIPAR